MRAIQVAVVLATVTFLAGCGGTETCRKAQPYEQSRLGKRVEVPEGLDPLNPGRELTIPDPSPRPPRAANAPCLELPPSFRIEDTPAQPAAEEPEPEPDPDDS